jgi:hypothetical protein
MPAALYIFYVILTACWIFTLVAPVLTIRWSSRTRFSCALTFSIIALIIAYLGATRFFVTSTFTKNGHTTTYDSRWFFMGSLAWCALAFALAIWKKVKFKNVA